MSAAAANRRVQLQDLVSAAKAGSGPVRFDQIAAAAKEIEALEAAAKRQEALRDRLSASNKSGSKKSDLANDLERIREEAFESDTALGKLARSSDILNQALAAGSLTGAEATAIMQALAVQTAENIAEEQNLGKMYRTTSEFLRLNAAEREALRQSRIIEVALAQQRIDLLSAENEEPPQGHDHRAHAGNRGEGPRRAPDGQPPEDRDDLE